MKELYVNKSGKVLIEEKGFLTIDTPFISYSITNSTFYKEKWGALHLISFIDADKVDFNDPQIIKETFYRELSFFKERSSSSAVIYYKILITQSGISQEVLRQIEGYYTHSLIEKKTFIPVVVDLDKIQVTGLYKHDIDKSGIINMLNMILNSKDNNPIMYNLEEIEGKLTQDYGFSDITSKEISQVPYLTYFLLAANIVMFIIMELSGGTQNPYVLKQFGMKINSLIVKGEYWRLISSAFIHIGIIHLAFNMYGLYSLGTLIEKLYGTRKYAFIYFLAGLWGSISSFTFSLNPSAGASGAIFGLFGAILFWGQKRPKIFSTSFGINIIVVLVVNLINGFITPGIDNYAHIGGFFGGYLSSISAGLMNEKANKRNFLMFSALALLTFCFILLGIKKNMI